MDDSTVVVTELLFHGSLCSSCGLKGEILFQGFSTAPRHSLYQHRLPVLPSLLLGENDSAHLENTLEALLSLDGVLAEAVYQGIFDAVLDALPAATKGGDAGALDKLGLMVGEGAVDHLLLYANQVVPGQVLAHHGESLVCRVDVGGLVYEVVIHGAANEGLHPFGSRLLAGNQSLGSQDAGSRVDRAREGVDGHDMLGFVVPGTVLLPVGCGYLVPRVVVGDGVAEDLHFEVVCRFKSECLFFLGSGGHAKEAKDLG